MENNIEAIRNKLFEAIDPNNSYTMDDFNSDHSNVDHTAIPTIPTMSTITTTPTKLTTEEYEMFRFPIKFVNKSDNENPEYATNGSAGFDLRANEDLELKSRCTAIVSTGLYFELPVNLEMQIRPRSGLAAKHSVTVLNSPGTIDSDYRGEVKIILINHGTESFKINKGDRIAQAVINAVNSKLMVNFIKVSELNDDTERGAGGFGSTGVN